ncbi:MAG: hypothetical protein LBH85_09255 [Treponema sp.]|jgi:hypothetical protein|nr:hypothetical protein [Treponema sp.]
MRLSNCLRREVKTLREANEILKKRPNFSSRHLRADKTPVMACQFMGKHRGEHAIREIAGIFGVGVGGGAYYKRAKKGARNWRA